MNSIEFPDMSSIQRILEERARVLAQPPKEARATDVEGMLVVALEPERYGLRLQQVQTVRELGALTPLPGTPPFWAGLANLRGRLLPVLDLRNYLGMTPAGAAASRKLVVVAARAGLLEIALLVDDVLAVRDVSASEVKPLIADIVSGVTADLLSLLDLDALLADPRLVVQQEAV